MPPAPPVLPPAPDVLALAEDPPCPASCREVVMDPELLPLDAEEDEAPAGFAASPAHAV
jgi:hypothetical protein